MKHKRIHVLFLAVLLASLGQISLADHHGHHHRHTGVVPWWWSAPGPYLDTPSIDYFPYDYPYDYNNVLPYDYAGPAIVPSPPLPATVPPPSTTPGGRQGWYYCPAAHGYYPYVPACPDGWQVIPATPPDLEK